MAEALHDRWKELGRKINETVKNDPDRYSIIYLEKPFVVPGGRFRECYYWDSYWTILGLLVSNMHETAKGNEMLLISVFKQNLLFKFIMFKFENYFLYFRHVRKFFCND